MLPIAWQPFLTFLNALLIMTPANNALLTVVHESLQHRNKTIKIMDAIIFMEKVNKYVACNLFTTEFN